ncbi:probable very-long-chain enoyl-CoA reductase art-1 [Anneissia japonica]|uniref:probable very-long-chain enoyl-CoA reductase art-1 n=1 Tax=Anneissia japonica TaxID=1529436 RepID=UPI001425628C|nr:probable very-long-chain enoyl-CoA reductase art-1 [Anneissia japonica]
MEIQVLQAGTGKPVTKLSELSKTSTIADVKAKIYKEKRKFYPDRQAIKSSLKGKTLKDDDTLANLGLSDGGELYLKDLGPQIRWKLVFLCEYTGPLLAYLFFYLRPAFIYGTEAVNQPMHKAVHIAAACWTFHYAKRLLETLFIHRFSHATMPIRNLFKNVSYYSGFGAYVSYYMNHPLYTPPVYGDVQLYIGLATFLLNEFGNFSIHLALRNLRPPGTKERRIPYPTSNPMTLAFAFVSCPNYTYEVGAWLGFTVMSQCMPAGLFTLAGLYQMAMWAMGKHRNYKKEFSSYPRSRKCIIPFLL